MPWRGRKQEALAIADRCEYRLNQADIHNSLAALALEEAERLLKELDVNPPRLEKSAAT